MKTNLLCAFVVSATLNLCAAYGQAGPAAPTLQNVLKLKPNLSIVFQPIKLQAGHTLDVTHLRFGDGSVKPGDRRAVQLVIYSATPNQAGQYEVLAIDNHVLDAQPVHQFASFVGTDDTSRKGIIAVLIGLLTPANQRGTVQPTVLPGRDSVTAEIHGEGIGLLLPAVQKVREAAAR